MFNTNSLLLLNNLSPTSIKPSKKETFIQPINELINTTDHYDVSPFLLSLKTAFDFEPIFETNININIVPASTILGSNSINKNNLEEILSSRNCNINSLSERSFLHNNPINNSDNSSNEDSDDDYKEESLSPCFCSSNSDI